MEGFHKPVLLREVLAGLNIKEGSWYIDATLGDGGHSLEVLKRGGKITGIDVDPESLKRAQARFEKLEVSRNNYRLFQDNFRDLKNLISQQTDQVLIQGIYFDLGVSSLQIDDIERGFSFIKNGPLDMRMDPNLEVKALDLVNGLNKGELNELFTKLGEESFSRRFAEALVSAREIKRITTTKELAEIIEKAAGGRHGKIHPATKVFQALRIAVNDELNALREALPQALEILSSSGRIVVISFHSLEDRIVKNTFKDWEHSGFGKVLTKKPIIPSEEEIDENPRSRSAKLRIFEKYDNNKKV